MNWDGKFLAETLERHDEVNSVMDVLLNFGGFMYIGAVMPWDQFNRPETTGLTYGRLFGLGFMVLAFRRIPAIFISYKMMPKVCKNWKEALFMGYFGPIGAGAVFYVEHTRHLFPELGQGDAEETNLVRAMIPVVYWLVLFSIVFHGLSIPALNLAYRYFGVEPVQDDAVELRRMSIHTATPPNAIVSDPETFIAYNRFSRPIFNAADLNAAGIASRRQSLAVDENGRSISRRRMSMARSRSRDTGRSRPSVPVPEKQPDGTYATFDPEDIETGAASPTMRPGRTIRYAE